MTRSTTFLPETFPGDAAERCAGNEKAVAGLHSIAPSLRNAGRPSGSIPELSENEIQKAVFQHLRMRGAPGIFAFHPKNASADMAGRKRGIHVGLGVEPGIPDVIVIKQWSLYPKYTQVYALELKRESRLGKKRTKHELNQDMTRARMINSGITVGEVYGLDEAIDWLERHGLLIGRSA